MKEGKAVRRGRSPTKRIVRRARGKSSIRGWGSKTSWERDRGQRKKMDIFLKAAVDA